MITILKLILTVLTPLSLLVLLIKIGIKYIRNRKIDSESKKKIYWELPAAIIAIFFALSALYFDEFSNNIISKFENIEKTIELNQSLKIEDNQTIISINNYFENKIEEVRKKNNKNVIFKRTLSIPEPIIGKEENQDNVIGKRFLGTAFDFEYYFLFPAQSLSRNTKEEENRRNQMLIFLFEQLTLNIWNDFEGFKNKYKIHYIPITRDYDTWTIINSQGDYECGYLTYKGTWQIKDNCPNIEALIILNNSKLKSILKDESNRLNIEAETFYKSQMKLPIYERDPCMIFYSNDINSPSLLPISKEELFQRISLWIKSWELEFRDEQYNPEQNIPKPSNLKELEYIENHFSKLNIGL